MAKPRLGGNVALTEDRADAAATIAKGRALSAPLGELRPLDVPLADVHPSPFQPAGRPSTAAIEAVRVAIQEAGSLAALVAYTPGGRGASTAVDTGDTPPPVEVQHAAFRALSQEARALAELAADIARNGVTDALQARPRAEGGWELISGHRRRVGARLAGLDRVPLVSLGPISDAEAASLVFARNRLREDFGPFHEAQALATLQRLRGGTVRELAASLGYSHGRAGILLQAAATFDDATRTELGGGDAARGTAAVAGLSFRQLRGLVRLAGDRPTLLEHARQTAKLVPQEAASTAVDSGPAPALAGPPIVREKREGGGWILTLMRSPDQAATSGDAPAIADALEKLAAHYRRAAKRQAQGAHPAR